jgi:hypothetical protein
MILPTKYISTQYSLIGIGALILDRLEKPKTVTSTWEAIKQNPEIGTFERFVLGLDFLHIIGAIEIKEGLLQRCHH